MKLNEKNLYSSKGTKQYTFTLIELLVLCAMQIM